MCRKNSACLGNVIDLDMGKERIVEIELMRVIAALVIMLYHMDILPGGLLAVELFAVLTGVLLFKSWARRDSSARTNVFSETCAFIVRKIRVFYPELFIATILGIMCYNYTKYSWYEGVNYVLQTLVGNLLLLKMSGFSWCSYGACPPVWYLSSMIFSILVIYPVISRWRCNLGCLIAGSLLFLFLYYHEGGVMRQSVTDWLYVTYSGNIRIGSELLISIGISPYIYRLVVMIKQKKLCRYLVRVVQYLTLIGIFALFFKKNGYTDILFLLLSLTYVVCVFARSEAGDYQLRNCSLLKYSSVASIAIFLTHSPALCISGGLQTRLGLNPEVNVLLAFLITSVFSLICIYGGICLRIFFNKSHKVKS